MKSKSEIDAEGFAGMRKETLLFAAVLFTTSLTASPSIPSSVAYLLVIMAYGALFLFLVSDKLPVFYYRPVLYPAAVIAIMFIVTFFVNFERSSVLRLLSFTVLTGINLIIVPALIDRRSAFKAIGRVTAVFVVIAIPVFLFGQYSIGPIPVGVWVGPRHFGSLAYYIPRSIFISSNSVAGLGAFGAIAAGAELAHERTKRAAALVVINAVGVFMTISRSALVVLGVGVGLYVVYRLFNVRGLAVASVGGLAALVVLVLTIIDVLSIPVVSLISPTGRDVLWKATIRAVEQRPFFGWGLGIDRKIISQWVTEPRFRQSGVHNSYLRLFLNAGIVAGTSYIMLSITSLTSSLREASAKNMPMKSTPIEEVFIVILLVGFLIYQTFGNSTIYGISPISTIGAVAVGYAQPRSAVRALMLPTAWTRLRRAANAHIPDII